MKSISGKTYAPSLNMAWVAECAVVLLGTSKSRMKGIMSTLHGELQQVVSYETRQRKFLKGRTFVKESTSIFDISRSVWDVWNSNSFFATVASESTNYNYQWVLPQVSHLWRLFVHGKWARRLSPTWCPQMPFHVTESIYKDVNSLRWPNWCLFRSTRTSRAEYASDPNRGKNRRKIVEKVVGKVVKKVVEISQIGDRIC